MRALFLVLSLVAPLVSALYSSKSDIVQATADNFKTEVLQHPGVVIVEFYAPWCGHCKQLVPEYDKAATILKGVVKIVAVDATQHESLAQKYQIQGFPTIKVFGADKKKPIDYQGPRTSDAIVSEGMRSANQLVKDRKANGGKKEKKESNGSESKEGKKKEDKKPKSTVVELTDANFNALVMESKDHWLVEFYAPWCGHCKKLAPEWQKAATRLAGEHPNIKLGAVDATVHTELAQRFGIKGFPTIKLFHFGTKSTPIDYSGPREAGAIIDYAVETYEKSNSEPVVITQLTSQDVFAETCEKAKLCAVLFLPHILDSGAAGRNKYLSVFQEVAESVRKLPFKFVWSEGGAQSALEDKLSINNNYPTVAVISVEKKMYSVPKVSWSKSNIKTFLNGIVSGTEKISPLATLPAVSAVPAWDGKDGQLEVDEIPLDDLFKEDL